MSTVTVRTHEAIEEGKSRFTLNLFIDGKPKVGIPNLSITTDVIEHPWSIEDTDPGAGVWRRYAKGITKYTLSVGGKSIMETCYWPTRTSVDGDVEWTWNNVEVTQP